MIIPIIPSELSSFLQYKAQNWTEAKTLVVLSREGLLRKSLQTGKSRRDHFLSSPLHSRIWLSIGSARESLLNVFWNSCHLKIYSTYCSSAVCCYFFFNSFFNPFLLKVCFLFFIFIFLVTLIFTRTLSILKCIVLLISVTLGLFFVFHHKDDQ